jgi:predicted PurR-regulated permease PerM
VGPKCQDVDDSRALAVPPDQITRSILAAGGTALGFGFTIFMGFIIAIWLLLGGPEISKWSVSVLPPSWRDGAREIGASFNRSFGGFIRGSIINMTITFLGRAVGFSLVGLPFAMPLALLVGVLDVIPFVGPIVGGAVAVLVALTVSWQLAVITLIILLIVEQSVDSFISPIVVGDSVRLHPLGILLALSIGGALGGLFGVIVSIPIAAAGYSVYLYFMRKNGVLEPEVPRPEKKCKGKRAEQPV